MSSPYEVRYNVFDSKPKGAYSPFMRVPGQFNLAANAGGPDRMTMIHRGTHVNENSETYVNLGQPMSVRIDDARVLLKTGDVRSVPPNVRHGDFYTPYGFRLLVIDGQESGRSMKSDPNDPSVKSFRYSAPDVAGQAAAHRGLRALRRENGLRKLQSAWRQLETRLRSAGEAPHR